MNKKANPMTILFALILTMTVLMPLQAQASPISFDTVTSIVME